MKRNALSFMAALVAFASGAFAAGSYVENFESISSLTFSGNQSTSLANGAIVYGSDSGKINIYSNNSPSWKALRLAQDVDGGTTSTYVIGTVENSGTRVNSFTASFDLLLKNSSGVPADRFSFNFGNLVGSYPGDGESGLWSSGQTGSMLSLVWDFYDNTTVPGEYVGGSGNGGVQLYKNGLLVSGSNVNNPVAIAGNLSGSFTRINLRYDEELNGGTFTFNTGGTVGAGNLISGGSNVLTLANVGVNFAAGDKFALSAATGGAQMDMFVDNVSINTVPEPSALSLLVVGLSGLAMIRRNRK